MEFILIRLPVFIIDVTSGFEGFPMQYISWRISRVLVLKIAARPSKGTITAGARASPRRMLLTLYIRRCGASDRDGKENAGLNSLGAWVVDETYSILVEGNFFFSLCVADVHSDDAVLAVDIAKKSFVNIMFDGQRNVFWVGPVN